MGLSLAAAAPGIGDTAAATKLVYKGVKAGSSALDLARGPKCVVTGKGCFVAGTQVLISEPSALASNSSSSISSSIQTLAPPRTVAIEQIQLGWRVPTKNPKPWEYDASLPEPDSATWCKVSLTVQRSDGDVVDMELLRPRWWLEENNLAVGTSVDIHVEELQVSGLAEIQSVEDSPIIAEGEGSVITSLFKTHVASELVTMTLEAGTSLTGTPVHPVWSLDRNDWVALGELQQGESLSAESGPIAIASIELLRSAVPVYNFETHGEHVYQVTALGLLVHNSCTTRANHVYAIFNKKTGEIIKYGISSGKIARLGINAGKSYRATAQLAKLSKIHGVSVGSFPVAKNLTRAKALAKERGLVNAFSVRTRVPLSRPPGNALPHATM